MHVLCDLLNLFDQKAYLVPIDQDFKTKSALKSPLLTKSIRDLHFQNDLKVMGVYDESVVGNPLKFSIVARWYLNRPGFLSGNQFLKSSEVNLNFVFAKEIDNYHPRLCVNTVDFDFFLASPHYKDRSLKLFYAGKLRSLGVEVVKPENVMEIHRSGPSKQSREELRNLFAQARVLYVAEDTAMVLEAAICGCPSIQLLEYFKEIPLSQEDGGVGLIKSESEELTFTSEFMARYICTLRLRELYDVAKFVILTQSSNLGDQNFKKPKFRFSRIAKLQLQMYKLKAGFNSSGILGLWAVICSHFQHRRARS